VYVAVVCPNVNGHDSTDGFAVTNVNRVDVG
jgi:hypothetical protein